MHRRLAARHAPDQIAHFLHRRRMAEQHPVGGRACLRQLQRGFHQGAQLIQRNRLGQIIEGARLEGGYGIFHVAVRGNHRHRHIQIVLHDVLHHLQAIAIGHPHIGQAQVIAARRQLRQRLAHIAGPVHLQPHLAQRQFQQLQDIRLIVHQQHGGVSARMVTRHAHAPRHFQDSQQTLCGSAPLSASRRHDIPAVRHLPRTTPWRYTNPNRCRRLRS